MFLIVAKMIEVLARACFTVAAAFMLALTAAGQFGIIATLVGLFAFAVGWERYIDLQRRLVGAEHHVFDRAVLHAFRLWGFNYLVMVPPFVLLTALWTGIGAWQLFLCVLILIGEHVSNQIYNLSVVQPRYHRLVGYVAARNLLLVPLIAYPILFDHHYATLDYVLSCWAAVAGVSTLVIAYLWVRLMHRDEVQSELPVATRIFAQHRASLTHFAIGMLGVASLQIDRLAVGSLLPLHDVGIYFRHVLLVSFAYQLFNIASYNRNVPVIFGAARTQTVRDAQRVLRFEQAKVLGVVIAGFLILWALDRATGGVLTARFSVRLDLAALLVAAALIRISADYCALILNSRMREAWVLRRQMIAFGVGSLLLIGLTLMFGMFGTAAAMISTSSIYYVLNRSAVARLAGAEAPAGIATGDGNAASLP
jgi:O-antigen/teichoic acid export membrane protein